MGNLDKKIKMIIRGVIVILIFWYSTYLQLIPVKIFNLDIEHLSRSMKVILSTFSSIIVLFILFFVYRKELVKDFKKFKDNLVENIDVGVRYWMIGLIIMMISNIIINYLFKAGGANNEQAVQSMIKTLPWLMLIDAGFIAPINEEIVFRKTLKDIFTNKWIFVILSFLLFGGVHVLGSAKDALDYLYIIPYGALGGAFALAYYETDTVFTSISMHMFHNIVLTLLSIVTMFL